MQMQQAIQRQVNDQPIQVAGMGATGGMFGTPRGTFPSIMVQFHLPDGTPTHPVAYAGTMEELEAVRDLIGQAVDRAREAEQEFLNRPAPEEAVTERGACKTCGRPIFGPLIEAGYCGPCTPSIEEFVADALIEEVATRLVDSAGEPIDLGETTIVADAEPRPISGVHHPECNDLCNENVHYFGPDDTVTGPLPTIDADTVVSGVSHRFGASDAG